MNKRKENRITGNGHALIFVFFIVSVLAVSVSIPITGAVTSQEQTGAISAAPVHAEMPLQLQPSDQSGVNPYLFYKSEPAPMGIADFGVGSGMVPYQYNTSSFLGSIHIVRLGINSTAAGILANDVVNGSGNIFLPVPSQFASDVGMTAQLNVNFKFSNNYHVYDYWIQDVVAISPENNSTSGFVSFEDNVWNMSSPNASMLPSTIKGNGTVSTFIGTGAYLESANSTLPGNNVSISYPTNLLLRVNSTLSSSMPEVIFQYNDGYGWVTFDNPVFIFATHVTQYNRYIVDGYNMNPLGLYYDSELILGGPGDGLYVGATPSTDLTMSLQYWNGHNYQYVPNAFNFGSDTAESMKYVTDVAGSPQPGSSIGNVVMGGSTGKLSMTYDYSQLASISIISPVKDGTLSLDGMNISFIGGMVNATVFPGGYDAIIYNSNGAEIFSHFFFVQSGDSVQLNANDFYSVTFGESGLPSGTSWSITVGSTTLASTSPDITFYLPNGTYTFTPQSFASYRTTAPSTFTVSGSSVSVHVEYSLVTFNVVFTQNGLPARTPWSVTLGGVTESASSGSEITFSEPNGTYNFSIAPVPGFTSNPSSGQVSVDSSNVAVSVSFTSTQEYQVVFEESGLQSGTEWSVVLNNVNQSSSSSSIIFLETNGTYSYKINAVHGYTVTPASGTVTVSGEKVEISITFTSAAQYLVVFSESGLSSQTTWSVTFNGGSESSDGSQIVFQAVDGSYQYAVSAVEGYTASPQAGTVVVDGSNVNINVEFSQVKYSVTFTETGLPPGSPWTVVLNGTMQNSTNSTIVFMEPNGVYKFSVYSIELYGAFNATPSSGNVTVDNANASESILFTPNVNGIAHTAIFSETGLPTGTVWSVTFNGVTKATNSTEIVFKVQNGVYGYTVNGVAGYISSPSSGTIDIENSSVVQPVLFISTLSGTASPGVIPMAPIGAAGTAGGGTTLSFFVLKKFGRIILSKIFF